MLFLVFQLFVVGICQLESFPTQTAAVNMGLDVFNHLGPIVIIPLD